MKKKIHQQMPFWIQAEKLTIQHMRPQSHRLPKNLLERRHRPNHILPGQTLPNSKVIGNISIVIVLKKLVVSDRRVYEESYRYQKNGHDYLLTPKDGNHCSRRRRDVYWSF